MEQSSHDSENLLEEDQGLEFDSNNLEIEGNNLEIDGNDLGIGGNELDIEQHNLTIEDDNLDLDEDNIEVDGQEVGSEGNELESNCDELLNLDDHILEEHRCAAEIVNGKNSESQGIYSPPAVGMEFESYDDAYNYYNCYAKALGFAIRVKSSWTKRNSKEKRGAVLCCNCEGFKTAKEANTRRKETRTGCLAMIRLRLVETNMWRVDEVNLEHNHSFDPERAQNSKSHKKMDAGGKRKVEPPVDVEVRTIKLYRTSAVDPPGYGISNSNEGESQRFVDSSRHLKFGNGDSQALNNFFCRSQQRNPNFFYIMDLNDEGYLRNVFWVSSRSRAAYNYFGDVVVFDTTYLSNKYEIPLFAFVGVNHHGQTILLGCGLLADETYESYIWLFRAWLTYMLGHPPQTIITDQCKSMQSAIAEVFPRTRHHFCLSYVVQMILENLVALKEYEEFTIALNSTIYDCLKVDEFEAAWGNMIHRFGIVNHELLTGLYTERERWAPVYAKDTFFAGMSTFQKGETMVPFFYGCLYPHTSLKEFLDMYELIIQKIHQAETVNDCESRDSSLMLRTNCYYEMQLSKIYTNEIFRKFQDEVFMMTSCFNLNQVNTNGPVITYIVKERVCEEGDIRKFEVTYDKTGAEVRCICGCFNFNGYLCHHALCILQYNGVEEIPYQYILGRWRKDFKHIYVPELGPTNIDISNPVQWYDHLYRRAMQLVEEGMISQDHFMVAWQALKESLNKVRLAGGKHV